ncbi:MAG: hypothetical protein QOJ11_1718 [Frankiales bacterium]|nr:hypothetical protein [Frankiales bacterium]
MSETEASQRTRRSFGTPGSVTAVVFFVLLVLRNADRLRHPIREAADFAANSMLIDRAEHLQQLTGNYSRVHFHHPGPAFFYVGALGQGLFHQLLHVVPADFNGQLIAYFALNAWLAGLVVTVLRRHIASTTACVAAISVVLLWLGQHIAISVPWPPYLYALPFLLLAVSGPSVVVGELRSLPAFTIAAGLLVHGHASFLMFVGVSTVAVVACWWFLHRGRVRQELATARRPLVTSGVIAFVFLLPMLLDLILHWPGQWGLYWRYSRQASSHPVGDVLTFTEHFWTGTWWGWLGFAAAVVVSIALAVKASQPVRRYLLGLLASIALLLGLVMFYAYRGIDDLTQYYTGDFSTVLPGLVLGTATLVIVQQLLLRWTPPRPVLAASSAMAGLLVLIGTGMAAKEAVYPGVDADLVKLQAMAAPGQPIILVLPPAGATWPKAFAVLEEAHRRDLPVCLVQPQWQFLATPAIACTAEEAATGKRILAEYVGPVVKRLTTVTWSGGHLEYTAE